MPRIHVVKGSQFSHNPDANLLHLAAWLFCQQIARSGSITHNALKLEFLSFKFLKIKFYFEINHFFPKVSNENNLKIHLKINILIFDILYHLNLIQFGDFNTSQLAKI